MKLPKSVTWNRVVIAVCGWSAVLVLGPVVWMRDRSLGSVIIAFALVQLFARPLRFDDERARSLRLKAILRGLSVSFVVLAAGVGFVELADGANRELVTFLPRGPIHQPFEIWDAIIITLVFAHGQFWWWRYRDGRETEASDRVATQSAEIPVGR